MKLEKIIKKKIEIKIKIVPGIIKLPKTASNSFFKKKIIFKNDFDIWELISQYICGKKNEQIMIDIQFIIIENEKIFTLGSKDENKFIIYIKIFLKKKNFSLLYLISYWR